MKIIGTAQMSDLMKLETDLKGCFRTVSILLLFFLFFLRSTGVLFIRGDSAPAYATFRCFCIQLCSVFGGQVCFKEAIMLVKYATLWLFTLPLFPCNLLGQYPFCFFFLA